jgi:hypothetical protein
MYLCTLLAALYCTLLLCYFSIFLYMAILPHSRVFARACTLVTLKGLSHQFEMG